MKSPSLITTAIVSAFVCVGPIQFVNAELPQGHQSQKLPLRVAWDGPWGDVNNSYDGHQGNHYRRQRDDNHSVTSHDDFDRGHRRTNNQSFEAQRRYEEGELEQQLDRAAYLRQINERTGNRQLIDMADRMEQRALNHYKQQLDRINELESRTQQPVAAATVPDPPTDSPLVSILKTRPTTANSSRPTRASSPPPIPIPTPQPTQAAAPQPTQAAAPQPTRANPSQISTHLQRQLINEQKVLQQRLDAADRVRQLNNGPHGNEQLLATADRMEQRAWEQFEQRVQRLVDPPRRQHQHYHQRHVADDVGDSPDQLERDVDNVEYQVAPQRKPVRRVINGLRNAVGR